MERHGDHDIIDRIQTDQELVAEFTSNMQLITKQTGVELTIDTSREGVAWMKPGETKVFFNPIYTLKIIKAIQVQRAKEFGIYENFTFDINHLSQLVLHEINHMINHSQLKMSDKKIKIGKKKLSMIEYEEFLHMKYGQEFHDFENMLEDIDVNNHATMIQAPVFEGAKQDIYHHITIPNADFSTDSLAEQFGWAILRESMIPGEKCIVDPRIRACIDYLSEPGEALEKLRDPSLNYDEQLPIIHRLFEEYYLKFKEEDKKNEELNKNGNQENQSPNSGQNGGQNHNENGGDSSEGEQGQPGNNGKQNESGKDDRQRDQAQQGQEGNNGKGQENQQSESGQSQQDQQGSNGEQNESGESSGQSNQRGGILGKLKNRLRKALGGDSSKVEQEDNNERQETSQTSQNDNNLSNSGEQPQNNDNTENNDTQANQQETGQKSGQKSGQESPQQRPQYRPGKPMLLPHIFENLDEEGNNLLEQIEQSLNGGNESKSDPQTLSQNNNELDSNSEGQKNSTNSQQIHDTIEQAIQDALKQQMEDQNKSPEERSLEAMIEQERDIDGSNKTEMRDIKNAIKRQTQLKEQIKKIKDSKGQSVYDKITRDIFSKIVQLRRWHKISERHARPFSEGGQLDPQNLVSGIIDRKAGDDDPRILQQEFREQKEKQKAGGFSITFILDGSGSMSGEKNRQQALSTLLMLYSLQQLNQDIKLEGGDMEDFLISTQAMMFCGGGQVALLKDRGQDLNMKDMIEVTNALNYCDGGDTNAADAINAYYRQVSKPFNRMSQKQYDDRREKIKDGKIKEILFVLSDGEFHDNPTRTIQKLREMGIIVCGIGITDEGSPIINYFGKKSNNEEKDRQGFGIVCEDASDLGNTLNELLIQHLEDPSIVG